MLCMAKKEKIIHGNKTTGIVKLDTGKYKFKVRFGTNKASKSDYGLFDKQKTVKVTTDAEAKKLFKKYKEEMQNQYIEEKARYEEKQEIVATQYTADGADESLLSMTFKEFTYFEKGNPEEVLFFSNIPRNNSGDNYAINTLNTLRKNIAVINQDAYSFFNQKKLVEIDSEDAEKLVEALRNKKWVVNKAEGIEKTMANSTLSNYVKSLKIIFNSLESTVKLRKKDSNPFMNVKVGTIRYKKDGKTSLDTVDEYDAVKKDDGLYKLDYWTNQWRTYFRPKLLEKGLIKNKTTLHDLRGSGISYYLIEKKMDVTVLARIVGHSDIAMTLNVYSHATDSNVKKFAKEIN